MSFVTPRDSVYVSNMRDLEFRAQGRMDHFYRSNDFEIVSREGNRKRDLTLAKDGKVVHVEEKYRTTDHGDLLVELIQDMVTNEPGWFYSERMDRLSYVILDEFSKAPQHVYWVKWDDFKDWFYHYLKEKKRVVAIVSAAGYGLTLNVAIPWSEIPASLWVKCKV